MNFILEFGYSRAQRKNNVLGPYQNDCQLLQNNLVGVSIVDGLVWKAVQDIVYPRGNCSKEFGVLSTI